MIYSNRIQIEKQKTTLHIADCFIPTLWKENAAQMDRIDRQIVQMRLQGMGKTDIAHKIGLPFSEVARRISRLTATGVLDPDWDEEEVIYVEEPQIRSDYEPEPDFVVLDMDGNREVASLLFKIDALMREVVGWMRQNMEVDETQITLNTPDGWTIERKKDDGL